MTTSNNPDNYLAPHSVEAEEAVLGSILTSPNVIYKVDFLTSNSFFILRNAYVWQAMFDLAAKGEAIDYITVMERLKGKKQLEEIGGSAYLTYLINNTPTHLNAPTYARIVHRAAIRRDMIAEAGEMAQLASSPDYEVEDAIDESQARLVQLKSQLTLTQPIDDSAGSIALERSEKIRNGETDEHFSIGIKAADLALKGGLKRKEHTIITARTSGGKSMLSQQIALALGASVITEYKLDVFTGDEIEIKRKMRVVYFNMESSRDVVVDRMISQLTGFNTQNIETGKAPANPYCPKCEGSGYTPKSYKCDCNIEYQSTFEQEIAAAALDLDENYDIDVVDGKHHRHSLRSKIMEKHTERPRDLYIIDHIHELADYGKEVRYTTLSEGARMLSGLSVELNAIFITCAQMGRGGAVNTNLQTFVRPQLQHIEGSDAIGQSADNILALANTYNDAGQKTNETQLWYLKIRTGGDDTPPSHLVFLPNNAQFKPQAFNT